MLHVTFVMGSIGGEGGFREKGWTGLLLLLECWGESGEEFLTWNSIREALAKCTRWIFWWECLNWNVRGDISKVYNEATECDKDTTTHYDEEHSLLTQDWKGHNRLIPLNISINPSNVMLLSSPPRIYFINFYIEWRGREVFQLWVPPEFLEHKEETLLKIVNCRLKRHRSPPEQLPRGEHFCAIFMFWNFLRTVRRRSLIPPSLLPAFAPPPLPPNCTLLTPHCIQWTAVQCSQHCNLTAVTRQHFHWYRPQKPWGTLFCKMSHPCFVTQY